MIISRSKKEHVMKIKRLVAFSFLISSMFGIAGCNNNANSQQISEPISVVYEVTLGALDICEVHYINGNSISSSIGRYEFGWTFKQYGDVYFELSKDSKKNVFSNSCYGYFIGIGYKA